MKYLISACVLTILAFCSCSNSNNPKGIPEKKLVATFYMQSDSVGIKVESKTGFDSIFCELNFYPQQSYLEDKNVSISLREGFLNKISHASHKERRENLLDSAGFKFTNALLNNIIPHWYGTPWDFEGHTSIPNKGEIACGYFVSTTLRDMGLNLNRYKLAQQNPKNEAFSIAIDSTRVRVLDENQIKDTLSFFKEGLYFVGLDNHVGYLYLFKQHKYFLHSNFIDGKVLIEEIENSKAFISSKYFISNITHNNKLMEIWVNKKEINIFQN